MNLSTKHRAFVEELDTIAGDLQKDCLQSDQWARIVDLSTAGNRLSMAIIDSGLRRIFIDGAKARNQFGADVSDALRYGNDIKPVRETLRLDEVRFRVEGLQRGE